MHASTSSLTVALVASATLLASQVQALPMTRSSSSVARRAHIATHHHHHDTRASDLQLGDHAIVVDASSAGAGNTQAGGIKNSTINLTSISHQNKRSDSTFSGFSRVVRSLFGVSTTRRRSQEAALPLTFAPSSAAAAAAAPTAPKIVTAPAAVNPKGTKRTKRSLDNSRKRTRRSSSRPRNFGKHPRPAVVAPAPAPIINLKKRATVENPKSTLVVPVAARYITRQVKRGGGATYTEALAQASVYSAAIAALPESTPTASAVLADVAPTVAAYIATPENNRNDSGSPYNGSPLINAPDGSYGNAAAARARSFSSTLSWASIAAAASTISSSSEAVPTLTATTPLVSVDSNGITWVQATAVATPAPEPLDPTSSTVINPKAGFAVSSSSSSSAAPMATASPSSTSALPTSPPPSTATLRR